MRLFQYLPGAEVEILVVGYRRLRFVWKACGHVSIYAPIDG